SNATSKMTLREKFDHLENVMSSQRFLKKQGLGNEVPFFICPFIPEETNDMVKLQENLIKKLSAINIRVLSINLYDLSIEILKEREIWANILEIENTVSKPELKELLQSVL